MKYLITSVFFLISLSLIGQTRYYGTEYSDKGEVSFIYTRDFYMGKFDNSDHYKTTYSTRYFLYDILNELQFLGIVIKHSKTRNIIVINFTFVYNGVEAGITQHIVNPDDFNGLTYNKIREGRHRIDIGFVSAKKEHLKIYEITENLFSTSTFKLDKK